MATLRQKVDALLLRAEEADSEERVHDILEGKKVEVSSRPSSSKTFGKRTPKFTIWIDGERKDWHSRKNEARTFIIELVDPVKIAEAEDRAKQAAINTEKRAAEQKVKEERLAPLNDKAMSVVKSAIYRLFEDLGPDTFTTDEVNYALRQAMDEVTRGA